MRAYRVETTLSEDGTLQLKALPFQKGDTVEVIVLAREDTARKEDPNPLRGKVLRYDDPTEPVAPDDWEALL